MGTIKIISALLLLPPGLGFRGIARPISTRALRASFAPIDDISIAVYDIQLQLASLLEPQLAESSAATPSALGILSVYVAGLVSGGNISHL